MKPIDIAKVCHEANRAFCEAIGDRSQVPWEQAPEWLRTNAINNMNHHLAHRDSQPRNSHDEWMREKVAAGWKYGPLKDPAKKEHPSIRPYDELPETEKAKDALYAGVVNALRGLATQSKP